MRREIPNALEVSVNNFSGSNPWAARQMSVIALDSSDKEMSAIDREALSGSGIQDVKFSGETFFGKINPSSSVACPGNPTSRIAWAREDVSLENP